MSVERVGMATRSFARRPRLTPPTPPNGEIDLEAPPELPRQQPTNVMTYVMPAAMVLMVGGFIVVGGLNPASLMMGSMMLMMTVGMLVGQTGRGPGKAQLARDRDDYLTYLAGVREDIAQVRQDQRAAQSWIHPVPAVLASFAGGRRMWERRASDEDFTEVRVATGAQELATPLRPPQTGPIDQVDPICAVALSQLVKTHSAVQDLPIAVRLSTFPIIECGGESEGVYAAMRALVAQLATFHGPDSLLVAAVVDGPGRRRWDWLKWLPHNEHPSETDGLGPVRMVAGSLEEVDQWLAPLLSGRPRIGDGDHDLDFQHLLVLVDGGGIDAAGLPELASGLAGVTILDLTAAGPTHSSHPALAEVMMLGGLSLLVSEGRLGVRHEAGSVEWLGRADAMSELEATALARAIAPYRLSEGAAGGEGSTGGATDLEGMLGLSDLHHLTPEQVWTPRPLREFLRVPIGVGPSGDTVELDLKESALNGMGPHGLVIGATGSGKSELLRTLVLALAVTHGPDTLNLVLIDFKGGATFAGLAELPHTAAVITNLQDDLTMVDRMFDALSGEMNRRQELLRAAGNRANVREYEQARREGADLPALPSLLIVCDEFTELLTQKPDFAELFVAIGRLGRSLGIHLLLASQRLEEGRLRGLDSHLSYRIGLKTFSAAESRTVLGVPDAYELPPVPGLGYLKFDTSSMSRFKAAYVSGPYTQGRTSAAQRGGNAHVRPVSFVSARVDLQTTSPEPDQTPTAPTSTGPSRTVLDVVVGRLEGHGLPAHEVWLPPLADSPTLDQFLALQSGEHGLIAANVAEVGLRVPIGIVDLPYEQRRDPLVLDFSGAAGNGVVVGGPQSGKSWALRTIVTALALTHTPREVQVYAVDLGGGSLQSIAGLPHVGGVATRSNRDLVRRLLAEVSTVVAERETRFREWGVESMAGYRRRLRAGDPAVAGDKFGDVFLVIDGWGAFREEFEDLELKVTSLAARSLSYGVHVLIAAARWQEVRPALKDSLGTRLELRLGDPIESEIDRRVAALVPVAAPGRGINAGKRQVLVALPRIDGTSDPHTVPTAYADLTRAVTAAWTGPRAPGVRMLPEQIDLATLPRPEGTSLVPIGLSEDALAPVYLDFDAEPHALYFADGESGKTTFLRTVITGIMAASLSADVRILLVDYRRTLLGLVPPDYLAGYAPSSTQLAAFLGDLVPLLRSRLPGPEVTVDQLRDRSWWTGPEVYVVVDDYDLVSSAMDNPLTALRELLPQAKDIGLHLVLARRTAGAARALYEPVVQTLRELGAPGFVGTGAADEGALVGPAKPMPTYPPGRGMLVTRRGGAQLIHVAMALDASAASATDL